MKFITTTHSTKVHFEMAHENSGEMDETRLKLGNARDQATIDISSDSLVATMVQSFKPIAK